MQWLAGFWVPKQWMAAKVELPIEHWKREHFLPFRPNQLIERLALRSNCREEFEKLRPAIDDFKKKIQLQYQQHHEYLIDLYSQFDPDRDLCDRALEVATEGSGTLVSVDESVCRSLFAEIPLLFVSSIGSLWSWRHRYKKNETGLEIPFPNARSRCANLSTFGSRFPSERNAIPF